jgi:hypothetical protein
MKQVFLILSVCFFSFNSYSQLTKNNWLLGGSGSFYSFNETYTSPTNNTKAKYTNIDFASSFGYFIIDKLAAGLRPTFSSFKGKVTSTGGLVTNTNKLAVGPFIRYYFLEAEKPFNVLTDISYQIGINRYAPPLKEKGKYNTLSIMAGTEIFFNTSVGLEILLGYKERTETIDNSLSMYKDTRKGFQASIGFTLHLEKK